MAYTIYFWAQHITNISPELIVDASIGEIPVDNREKRKSVVSLISDVSRRNTRIGSHLVKCSIFNYEDKVVIDVDTEDIDSSGRKSNITCYVDNIYELTRQDWLSIKEKLKSYAATYDRSIKEDSLDEFERCFLAIEELQKKRKLYRKLNLTCLGLIVLLLFVLLWQLLSR